MSIMRIPLVIPIGWQAYREQMIVKEIAGMGCIFSLDEHDSFDVDCPAMGAGIYCHLSLSRKDKYPGWDEMRDFIYSCGLFDNTRDVCMFLPPKKQYVNVHENCFHFYQKKS